MWTWLTEISECIEGHFSSTYSFHIKIVNPLTQFANIKHEIILKLYPHFFGCELARKQRPIANFSLFDPKCPNVIIHLSGLPETSNIVFFRGYETEHWPRSVYKCYFGERTKKSDVFKIIFMADWFLNFLLTIKAEHHHLIAVYLFKWGWSNFIVEWTM